MIETKTLDDRISSSPQIKPHELPEVAKLGFRSIIVNRPDGEEPGQPTIEEMRRAASEAGLGFAAIPVVLGKIGPHDVEAFRSALATLPLPAVAYCRTGTRAAALFEMSK